MQRLALGPDRLSKMAAKKVDIFVTGTMNSYFFVTGQIGIQFGHRSILYIRKRCGLLL